MYLSDEDYKNVFSKTPRLCVDLLIPYHNSYLIGKRTHEPFKERWAIPGGRVQFGESLRDAVNRICENELGSLPKYVEFHRDIIEYPEEIVMCGVHSISLAFFATLNKLPVPGDSFTQFEAYHGDNQIKDQELIPSHLNFLHKVITNGMAYV